MTNLFNDSKYTKWYFNIVNRAKLQNRTKLLKHDSEYVYYERHHIKPKSMGGLDIDDNLILLTAKEHFVCHLLLIKMCVQTGNRNKMIYAFNLLSNANGNSQQRITGRHIEWAKNCFIKVRSETVPWNKGKHGIYSAEARQKMGEDKIGKVYSDEYKQNMSKILKTIQPSKKRWSVILPSGETITIDDRRAFCIEHNLSWGAAKKSVYDGNRPYKGYIFKEIAKDGSIVNRTKPKLV